MQDSAHFMSAFLPGHEVREVQNKLEAFRLFAYVDQKLKFPADRPSLPEMVRLAEALPPFQRIFALEGVAHFYTSTAATETPMIHLLADPELPDNAMVPLHSGMGTTLASAALARLGDSPSPADLRKALEDFFELCHDNSREGWYINSIEAMGLAVRTLYPHLRMQVSEEMGEIDEAAQPLFWHGVGRALYFVPMNFITFGGSHERALRAAFEEAPTLEDRHNTVAGLAWALTLVNIQHPIILETFLHMCRGTGLSAALSNGVVSALMVWRHMVPEGQEILAPYLSSSTKVASPALWNDVVAMPAAHAFAEIFPALTRPYEIGQPTIANLFEYQDMRVSQA